MIRSCLAVCVFTVLTLGAVAQCDVITDWNNVVLNEIRAQNTNPPYASRGMAMMHLAMYDAVDAIEMTHQMYYCTASAIPGSSKEAAAAQAAHDVLVNLYPSDSAKLNAALAASLAVVPDGASKTNGISLGQQVASQIVAWRSNDGSSTVVPYTPSTDPGKWRPTPPSYAPALLPNWPYVTPFCMTTGSEFRGSGPPPMTSAEYAASFNDVKSLGAINSTTRTAYQTQTAYFWADGGGTSTPPGHWNMIAQTVAAQKGNTLSENARMFALLNMSLADAAICAWDNKYGYNSWRPITAIQLADEMNNPLCQPDPNWEPLLTTPNFPEYVSGHSTFSGAAAEALGLFYGTDNVTFTIGSDGLPGVYRTYDSFSQAAYEAGRSRIYGGIHFEFSDASAIQAGGEIAQAAFTTALQPIPEPSTLALAGLSGIAGLGVIRRRRA